MPTTLTSEQLNPPRGIELAFGLDPVPNLLNSLLLLSTADQYSGLDEWVARTIARLTPAQLDRNRLVLDGMHYALQPQRRWPSFLAYVDDLERTAPTMLRDRLLSQIARPHSEAGPPNVERVRPADLLADVEMYIGFLRQYYCDFNEATERAAHALLNEPAEMQRLMVMHLREMWQLVLASEWERTQPLVQETVSAFQQVDLSRKSISEAIRIVTGHDTKEKWEPLLARARQVVFVPSPHIGPYLYKWSSGQIVWIVFGARLPEGMVTGATALSRSDLLVRLSALTDDTRLRILALLSQHDELCAQDIMTLLDLTQSATSRHLRQLSATGYITERRREIAKCYTLNRERIGDTFRALERFLARSQPRG